jgi:hypothetical protein
MEFVIKVPNIFKRVRNWIEERDRLKIERLNLEFEKMRTTFDRHEIDQSSLSKDEHVIFDLLTKLEERLEKDPSKVLQGSYDPRKRGRSRVFWDLAIKDVSGKVLGIYSESSYSRGATLNIDIHDSPESKTVECYMSLAKGDSKQFRKLKGYLQKLREVHSTYTNDKRAFEKKKEREEHSKFITKIVAGL